MKFLTSLFLFSLMYIGVYAQHGEYILENYEKREYEIEMRDGIRLFTQVYAPKDTTKAYPFLLQRTCYSVRPYGEDSYKERLGPSETLLKEGYIFVYQDVRGRYMSEGVFDNMRPNRPGNKKKSGIDESSDTYDTIDWLLENVKNNNGKVGQWGISYPGFYTAAAIPDAHPALRASSPQAPIGDFYFDDFHHNGALLQSYLVAYPVFGVQKTGKTKKAWYGDQFIREKVADAYDWHLELGPLSNVTEKYYKNNFFWQQMVEHPTYDKFWQERGLIQHLGKINHSVMTVGGFFDAEDLYGPLSIYKKLEKENPDAFNIIVMGPWSHGDWAGERGKQTVNHIYFGDSLSTQYQREVEAEFFNAILKEDRKPNLPEAYIFDTGLNKWNSYEQWPPASETVRLGFGEKGKLLINETPSEEAVFEYISDPSKPVPYRSVTEGLTFTPRAYMTDDQRHANRRTDVLSFSTDPMEEDFQLSGELMAELDVILEDIQDADFVVKLIDVFPQDHPNFEHNDSNIKMGGYQMLVRAEVMRGRYRMGFDKAVPFEEGKVESVKFQLQDLCHTIKKGHKLMIQIHSTWFPYIDRNPQKFIENIFEAEEDDFTKGTIRILGTSSIKLN